MTTFYDTLAVLVSPTVALIFVAAALAGLVAWAAGGDREDAARRGTYDAGVADPWDPATTTPIGGELA